jgi:hypothetical protein
MHLRGKGLKEADVPGEVAEEEVGGGLRERTAPEADNNSAAELSAQQSRLEVMAVWQLESWLT